MTVDFKKAAAIESERQAKAAEKERIARIDRETAFSKLLYAIDGGDDIPPKDVVAELEKAGRTVAELEEQLDLLARMRRAQEEALKIPPNRTPEENEADIAALQQEVQRLHQEHKERMYNLQMEKQAIRDGQNPANEFIRLVREGFQKLALRPEQLAAVRAGKPIPPAKEFERYCSDLQQEPPAA